MKLNDSVQLYLGLVKILRACVKDIQVWPSYYIWNQLGTPAFTDTTDSKAGYSMSVATTSSGRTRVAIGMPFANGNFGRIKVFEFSADYVSYVQMSFNPTSMAKGTAVQGFNVADHHFGKSIALSKDGQVLVVGAPCAVTVESVGGWTPGFIRVFSCAADSTVWNVNGIHTNPGNAQTDLINGYIVCPVVGNEGGINGSNKFGFAVALNDNGSVVFASLPNSGAGSWGVIFRFGKNSTTGVWTFGGSNFINATNAYNGYLGKNIKVVNNTTLVATTTEGNSSLFKQSYTAFWIGATLNIIWGGDGLGTQSASGTDPAGLNNDAIDVSSNGLVLAIGFPNASSNKGQVKVYNCTTANKTQIGQTIVGPTGTTGKFGTSVSLNNNGTILAIGSKADNGNNGSVIVYKLVGGTWTQYSQKFDGDAGSNAGFSVDLNSDATKLFYTSPLKLEGGVQKGGLSLQAFPVGSKIYPNL